MARQWMGGKDQRVVAESLDCAQTAVACRMRKLGKRIQVLKSLPPVDLGMMDEKLAPLFKDRHDYQMLRLFVRNWSTVKIAERLGLKQVYVYKNLLSIFDELDKTKLSYNRSRHPNYSNHRADRLFWGDTFRAIWKVKSELVQIEMREWKIQPKEK